MNILLLVSSFLLILTFGIFSLRKESHSSVAKQHYFTTFLNLERQAQNGAQTKNFRQAQKKEKKEKKEPSEKSSRRRSFSRDLPDPYNESKLNLSPLFEQPQPLFFNRLYEIAAAHLRYLYGETEVGLLARKKLGDGFEYRMLDALIEKGRQERECTSFEKLFPDDAAHQEIYLKMVKGTKLYMFSPSKGYPPLEDFFLLQNDKRRKPVYFCFASTQLLKAVFGEALATSILDIEKGYSRALNTDELKSLILKDPGISASVGELETLLDPARSTSAPRPVLTITGDNKISRKVRQSKSKAAPSP